MGQELNGSLGLWVTLSDPFPALGIVGLVGPRLPTALYQALSVNLHTVPISFSVEIRIGLSQHAYMLYMYITCHRISHRLRDLTIHLVSYCVTLTLATGRSNV